MNRFEVNIALNGQHFCRCVLPDMDEASAIKKAKLIRAMYAQGSGWEVTMTRWNNVGHEVTI